MASRTRPARNHSQVPTYDRFPEVRRVRATSISDQILEKKARYFDSTANAALVILTGP